MHSRLAGREEQQASTTWLPGLRRGHASLGAPSIAGASHVISGPTICRARTPRAAHELRAARRWHRSGTACSTDRGAPSHASLPISSCAGHTSVQAMKRACRQALQLVRHGSGEPSSPSEERGRGVGLRKAAEGVCLQGDVCQLVGGEGDGGRDADLRSARVGGEGTGSKMGSRAPLHATPSAQDTCPALWFQLKAAAAHWKRTASALAVHWQCTGSTLAAHWQHSASSRLVLPC